MKVQKLSYVFLLSCSFTGTADTLMDRFWDGDIFADPFFSQRSSTVSSISQRGNLLVLKFAMAGMRKEDVKISVTDDRMLVVKAERQQKAEKNEKTLYQSQASMQSYYQSLQLPENVDSTKIDASMKDGILEITIPYKELTPKKEREIKIK
jgi:HSP20 family molecular chaperone IbpA